MGIRVIFDESRASVTSPVPYTKLFSAISADLRCAERWRPGIKMRFIEDGMSVLGHSQQMQSAPKSIDVRFAPKATVSHRTAMRRNGPKGDICSAANHLIVVRPSDPLFLLDLNSSTVVIGGAGKDHEVAR
jgi:hypothetical protein